MLDIKITFSFDGGIFFINKTFPLASVLRLCAFFFSYFFVFSNVRWSIHQTAYFQVPLPILLLGYSGRFIRPIGCASYLPFRIRLCTL